MGRQNAKIALRNVTDNVSGNGSDNGDSKVSMPKDKLTIKDVARAAGVSTQTVSRVLNNRLDVSADTRAHVQQVIARLGYSPNVFARNLSRGRSNSLGVIGYGLVYYGSSSVLTGIESKANELGFSLTLSLIDRLEPKQVEDILYDLLSRRVEGIIWAVPAIVNDFEWLAEKFSKIQTPVVYINKGPTDSDFVSALDNRYGGRLATQYLMDQGYNRIGIITGPKDWWETQERLESWREVVTNAGYSDVDNLIVEGDWSPPSGDVGLQALLDQEPEVDAVFVSNDQMALGALQAARRLGLSIPEDLGIVGFDDIPEAAYFYPSLTTVRQEAKELGALAVDRISVLIQAQQAGDTLEPDISWSRPRLIVRKSAVRKQEATV
jgi:DNA-binding LacI/PurR family transcriptional regulator